MSGMFGGLHVPKVIPFYLLVVLATTLEFSVLWLIIAGVLDALGQVL